MWHVRWQYGNYSKIATISATLTRHGEDKMSTRILAATLFAAGLFSTAAVAEPDLENAAVVLHYSQEETPQYSSLLPKDSGSRYALSLKWTESADSGLLYAYRAKLYSGRFENNFQANDVPSATATNYSGITHEGQLIARQSMGDYRLDYVGGLGWDSWQRSNNMNVADDYSTLFMRTGISLDQSTQASGFHGSGGLKLPLRASQDPYLDSGASPQQAFRKGVSLYAELAYRPGKYWDIVGYYDSSRFKQSESIGTPSGISIYSIAQPQTRINTLGLKAMYSF